MCSPIREVSSLVDEPYSDGMNGEQFTYTNIDDKAPGKKTGPMLCALRGGGETEGSLLHNVPNFNCKG